MTDEDVVTMDYETVKEAAVEDADYQRLIARGRTGDWPASKCKEFIGLRPYYQVCVRLSVKERKKKGKKYNSVRINDDADYYLLIMPKKEKKNIK